ncbi:histidine kinase dimerization/phospho-acceptor domain-containing protein [Methanolobus sp.]|jgi:PAS domain S-box-containing protein|uniref:histidine kinase dimerization/phospho-acceptor domain-containing protein n=1 Tax=Methanolobus sp. TaxID=1874737 RepID=UPI0025F9F982|nr:histidine kinase dimerization/phospho-acceptor domain-containing protein [Methanolobus sp.]
MKDIFEIIFNSVNDGIVINSLDGRFLEMNQITCDDLGYTKKELLQMNVADIIPLELREELREQVAEKLKMGNGIIETLCKCKDDLLVPIELNVRPINYKGVPAALIVVRNITERKKAEKALIEAKNIAEESNRVKSEFIANMSHELRTPLNSVIGFSQILIDKEYGDLNEKQIEYISNVQKSGNHLLEVINDILDFSKIESGKMDLNLKPLVLTN